MTHVINLFYPPIDNINHPEPNKVPEKCLFCIDDGELVFCFNFNKQSNKLYRTALCQFEFPEPDIQNSVQLKMESMIVDEYGHLTNVLYVFIAISLEPKHLRTKQ